MFATIEGIGIFATYGEVAGAAVIDGNHVAMAYATTEPFTGDDDPFLTVALRIRDDVAVGSRSEFTLDPSSADLNGTVVRTRVSPGRVTVGGSVAISDVIPGDGWFPAGTVVSVRGVGFNSRSRLKVDDIAVGSVRVMSSTEIRFTLREAANMTAQRLRVDNPDGSRSTYYSHMRGIPAATSGRTLLSTTQPFFSGTKRSVSTFGPIPAMNGAQYAGLALQNPNLTAAAVTIALTCGRRHIPSFLHAVARERDSAGARIVRTARRCAAAAGRVRAGHLIVADPGIWSVVRRGDLDG